MSRNHTDHEDRYRRAERALWAAHDAEPVERRVPLVRLGVNVRVQEVGEGHPVLFVHGGPNAGSKWAPLVGRLSGLRCLLVDRPGTGLSDPLPRRLGVEEMRDFADDFVADVLDALEIERAHVVASSLGGYLALRSAAATPSRFGRMVQMSCPALAPGMRTPSFLRLATMPVLGTLLRRLPPSRSGNVAAMRQMGHGATIDAGAMPDAYDEWYLALQRHTRTVRNDGALIAGAARRRGGFDARLALDDETLGSVRARTLFLWGADDGFGGADVGHDLVARMPSAEISVLTGCGHLPWLDRPVDVAAAVQGWLGNAPGRSRATSPVARPAPRSSVRAVQHPGRSSSRPSPVGGALVPTLMLGMLTLGACGTDGADAVRSAAAAPAVGELDATITHRSGVAAPPLDEAPSGSSGAVATTAVPSPAPTPPPTSDVATNATTPSSSTTLPPPGSRIEITAVDFGFRGVPTELSAGSYEFAFRNDGAEVHELFVFRNPAGLGPHELHELGPAGIGSRVEIVGLVFADPGGSSPQAMQASLTPGEYEVICFIPTPTDGRPHFAHGMHTTFTVR